MKTFILVQRGLVLYPYFFDGEFNQTLEKAWSLLMVYSKVIVLIPAKTVQIELYQEDHIRTASILQEDKILAEYLNHISKYHMFKDLLFADLNL